MIGTISDTTTFRKSLAHKLTTADSLMKKFAKELEEYSQIPISSTKQQVSIN